MNLGANPFSFSSSGDGDGIPGHFPAGLRVLVVDDDPTCLRILEKMLKNCLYEVTTCNRAEIALDFLRDGRNVYDVVISDVHMPDMDGFKLLEHVGLEMDLPVIMMSADDSKDVVMKGVTHGACDYLIKPVRMEALKNIWQHVVRRKKHEWKDNDFEQSASVGDQKPPEDIDYSSSASEGNWTNSKKRKDVEGESEERDDPSALKRPRVVWSVELHQQFVSAVNQLGIDKAVPKKILELMNVPGLTRENVASHLQKYRLYLRRLSGVSQHPNGHSFIGPPDFPFGPMPPLNAVDFQALAASGQIPPQSLAALQAAAFSNRATPDQRNVFSFDNPKLRFLVGHHQPQNNIGNPVNLLHGIPTNMHIRPQNNPLRVPMLQPKSFNEVNSCAGVDNVRGQSMDFPGSSLSLARNTGMSKPREEVNGSQGQPIVAPAGVDSVRGQNMDFSSSSFSLAGIPGLTLKPPEEVSGSRGQPVFSRTGVDRGCGQSIDSSGSSFSLAGNAGMSRHREEVNGPPGFVHNYDVFNGLNQDRAQDWCLQNAEQSFEHSYAKSGQSRVPSVNRPAFSEGLENVPKVGPKANSSLADHNPLQNKVERMTNMGFQNVGHSHEQFGQDDLVAALLKEQQDGVAAGPTENEFSGLDGYHMDNVSV